MAALAVLGVPVWFSERLAEAARPSLRALEPTFLFAPPRVWERVYASISTEIGKTGCRAQDVLRRGGPRAAPTASAESRFPRG